MKRMNWTEQKVREIASSCKNKRDLQIRFVGAYKAAVRLNILNDIFPEHAQTQWSTEMLAIEASKYETRGALAIGSPSAYVIMRQRGLLDQLAPAKLARTHTTASLIKLGKSYETRTDFAHKDPGAYSSAQRRGILDIVCQPNVGGVSRGELELLAFLQSLVPDFSKKRFGNDYELDAYSPSLKVGVEYNGLYWHSSANFKMSRSYHIDKTKYFEKLGIRVIHIWENEWRFRQLQVQNYLQSATGANSIKIGARKCKFREIDKATAREFLNNTHIQGQPNLITLALGCFYKDTLVSVTTFGPHHRKGSCENILNRFACLPGHTVIGSLAKTTKMAFEKLGELKSWADYSKSQARGYIAAGWVIAETLPPDYFYTDKSSSPITKQSRRKSKVKTPEGMTETQHATKDGLYRVWDCGKIVLIYKKSA